MKTALRKLALGVLLALAGFQQAAALPLATQKAPAWVLKDALFDIDFANKRCWNCVFPQGSTSGTSQGGKIFYESNNCTNGSTCYNQWKDGILRPSGPSAVSEVPRFSDYGLWIEGGPNSAHNYLLCSRDLTATTCATAWTPVNMTVTTTGVVGADGVNNKATKITATTPAATVLQTIAFTGKLDTFNTQAVAAGGTAYSTNDILTTVGGTCTTQPQLKVTTQVGGVISAVSVQTAGACTVLPPNPVAVTGGTGLSATFNVFWRTGTFSCWIKAGTVTGSVNLTTNGGSVLTDISGQLSSSKYLQVRAPTINLVNNIVGITLGNSGDSVNVDFCQIEDDDQATSPILNTTSLTQRGTENVFIGTNATQYNFGGVMLAQTEGNRPFSYVVTYSGNFSTTLGHGIITSDTGFVVTGLANGGVMKAAVGGNSVTSTATDTSGMYLATTGAGTVNKVVVSIGGSGSEIFVNGAVPVKSASVLPPSAFSGTHVNILNNGSNVLPVNGYVSRMSILPRALSDGECQQYSTVVNNQ